MTTEAVYKFLKDKNRPYAANDILENIGKDHSKSAIQKSLDKLLQKNNVIEKVYGKQKIYSIVQADHDPSQMEEELLQINQEIDKLSSNLTSTEEKLHVAMSELKSLQSKMTTEEAKIEKDKLLNEVSMLKNKLNNLSKENAVPISEKEKTKIYNQHEMYTKEYKKRKRICMDIINSILENYPKTKKHLLEEIGIETDEDVGFQLE